MQIKIVAIALASLGLAAAGARAQEGMPVLRQVIPAGSWALHTTLTDPVWKGLAERRLSATAPESDSSDILLIARAPGDPTALLQMQLDCAISATAFTVSCGESVGICGRVGDVSALDTAGDLQSSLPILSDIGQGGVRAGGDAADGGRAAVAPTRRSRSDRAVRARRPRALRARRARLEHHRPSHRSGFRDRSDYGSAHAQPPRGPRCSVRHSTTRCRRVG
jgi:hypothetical protein